MREAPLDQSLPIRTGIESISLRETSLKKNIPKMVFVVALPFFILLAWAHAPFNRQQAKEVANTRVHTLNVLCFRTKTDIKEHKLSLSISLSFFSPFSLLFLSFFSPFSLLLARLVVLPLGGAAGLGVEMVRWWSYCLSSKEK